jgi:thiol reductant ABC exporter CydC subunit
MNHTLRILLRVVRLAGPYRWSFLAAIGLGAATVGSGIALMATSALLIAQAALRPSIADLSLLIVSVRFFGIARGVFRYLERYVAHDAGLRLLARLRVWFLEVAEPLAPAGLGGHKSGDLLARAVADIDTLQDLFVRMIAPPVVALVTSAAMSLFFWQFHHDLAPALLAFLLAAGVIVPLAVQWISRRPSAALVAGRSDLQARLVEGLQGMADAIAFGAADRLSGDVRTVAESLAAAQRRMVWIAGWQSALTSLTVAGAMATILVLAISLVETGTLDGVYLAMLVLAAVAAFEAVLPLGPAFQALEGVLAAARRLFSIADTPPPVSDPDVPVPLAPPRSGSGYDLEVRNLTFAYRAGDAPVLQDVGFRLPAGGRIAIVGPSGAGKSTLVNLLLRFWDYGVGEILLDGTDLRRYRQEDVRRLFSVISQQTGLFAGTIRDNIALAKPTATEEEIVAAAQRAQLHAFVASAPRGYETWIGEEGLQLSGGERQRLALARVLLRDAPIAILDEPTAHLDPLTERALLEACWTALAGRSILLITHRLVGLEAMDEILVLRSGAVVERGSHQALLAAAGWYARMKHLQDRYTHPAPAS